MPKVNRTQMRNKKIKYKVFNNKNINYAEMYGSRGWKMIRAKYFAEHPLCEDCLEKGIITPATDVHHVVPFSTGVNKNEQIKLLLDDNNLRSLCKKCHMKHHSQFAHK